MLGTVTKGTVALYNRARVVPLTVNGGNVAYVTDTAKPEIIELDPPDNFAQGTGSMAVSLGASVTLAAPPAAQVINGAELGLFPP